jgi:hypothetical protein
LKASNGISSRKVPRKNRPKTEDSSCNTAERFALTGPSIILDPLIHAYRADLADIALAGQLFAPHYARPVIRTAGPKAAPVHAGPAGDSEHLFDLEPGTEFAVLDCSGGWAWGYRRADHRVGYVRADALKS